MRLGYKAYLDRARRRYIVLALKRANWNVSRAARAMSMSRPTLHGYIADLGIVRPIILTRGQYERVKVIEEARP